LFSFARDSDVMTIIPKSQDVDQDRIGNVMEMSPTDISSLNKVYSCNAQVPTNGGGHQKVDNLLYI
jgi:hypothetical protein